MKGWVLILLLLVLVGVQAIAGDTAHTRNKPVLYGKVVDGDTLLFAHINEVTFYAPRTFDNQRDYRRYKKLIYNIKKAYPYAVIAGNKLEEVNNRMLAMNTDLERKKYMKEVEDELRIEFEDDLKKLTITQGKILIKLIDRETGNTSYELVKELRGSFSAVFWQTMARLFGSNLKTEFDAEGTDKLINEIVVMIENGQL
jgi:hypothetical protein